jgi:acyl-CoA thioesterase-1
MGPRSTILRHACRWGLLVVVLAWASPAAAAKIACVGDSITYGYGLPSPGQQSYPAVLQTLVGSTHTVRNFGTSGCTLLKQGDKPYWNDANFAASDAFKPDVVIVMLGTNDAKPQNWSHKASFATDYASLIDHYRNLGALVYVAVPPPVYPPGAFDINPDVLSGEIVPLVRQIAASAGAPLIDVFAALSGKASLFPDTVHPNAEGAQVIAQTAAAALQTGGFGGASGSTGGAGGSTAAAGGSSGTGGSGKGSGGISGSGGEVPGTGGGSATGGIPGSGGSAEGSGGVPGTGGSAKGSGGSSTGTGGTPQGSGGTTAGSGGVSTGGASGTDGGPLGSGGVSDAGGRSGSGGAVGQGGRAGGSGGQASTSAPSSGGNAGTGGAAGGSGGATVRQPEAGSGCGCRIGGKNAAPGCALLVGLLLLATRKRRRARDS